mmetsp:Transcript_980/g.1711  ORF Transcript_980/g.1711 Transcript_980/m.1711 type:complete len:360 (-) Transcript_980:121-1200(-)|eukprot:CAMPEP_0118657188 /NCGR_PEP_ID=MMETSP0785-20121206/13884_1 /TAXON_ID=91992 /ORGANISM="Bolidomonas pacifica, Strain CCMP 1866" /LENGTH=359 /DNA_ID=CAMNT_0006550087 /DNA_START=100 /DNA_END=1179 /DNA_ORIENTATION=+
MRSSGNDQRKREGQQDIECGDEGAARNNGRSIVTSLLPSFLLAFGVDERSLSFMVLIFVSIAVQLMFKYSQEDGAYSYNTYSSMAITELIKFGLACMLQQQIFATHKGSENPRQFFAMVRAELQLHMNNTPYLGTYVFLAFSYAACNQMVFKIMTVADPGIFSLIKSSSPIVVASMNFAVYRKTVSKDQLIYIVLLVCGLIAVTSSSCDKTNEYTVFSLSIMTFATVLSAFNAVVNANALKELTMSMPMQNMVLYAMGFIINLLIYFLSNKGESFFKGYGKLSVWALIFLNSSIGLAVNAVYKYGDAVLKTFAQPVCSSWLVFLSWALFGMELDKVKIAGAVIVTLATYMYTSAGQRKK